MADARSKYVPPATCLEAFSCPRCRAFAQQNWHTLFSEFRTSPPHDEARFQGFIVNGEHAGTPHLSHHDQRNFSGYQLNNTWLSECSYCEGVAIWVDDRLLWPQSSEAPSPNPDLPDDVRADYEEAGAILDRSPRGAAALLRLAIQKLCKHLGEKGENLNRDIGELVKKGLDPGLQEAFDIVRVTGNNAVHPGEIDVDDRATAETLFGLVNDIAEETISRERRRKERYAQLPERDRRAIERRDVHG